MPGTGKSQPLVTVVTVNHNGAHLLPGLLEALRVQTWERREVLVVDNASDDDSLELLRRDYPEVRVLERRDNSGFVGGNNAGIRAARGELVALANNDTVPGPRWIEELAETLVRDPELAAAGSKLLFLRPYLEVRLRAEREVLVGEGSAFAGCGYRKPVFREGFLEAVERGGERLRRITGEAVVLLPVREASGPARLDLRVAAPAAGADAGGRRLEVEVGGHPVAVLAAGPELRTHPVEVPAGVVEETAFDLINNAGTALSSLGDAADRGIYQPDRGQYDREEDLEAICGAACLFRRSALDRVGLFDRDFFMYYEDTDLSWRLRKAGYRLRYQPRSRIRHVHAASSVEWSPLFVFYTARNKILMIAKNAGPRAFLRALWAEARCMIGLLVRAWRGRRGADAARLRGELATRLRVYGSLLVQVPRAWLKRAGLLAD